MLSVEPVAERKGKQGKSESKDKMKLAVKEFKAEQKKLVALMLKACLRSDQRLGDLEGALFDTLIGPAESSGRDHIGAGGCLPEPDEAQQGAQPRASSCVDLWRRPHGAQTGGGSSGPSHSWNHRSRAGHLCRHIRLVVGKKGVSGMSEAL